MNIKPLFDKVLILPRVQEKKSVTGIILPNSDEKESAVGEVIAVGDKEHIKAVLVGDMVVFDKSEALEVPLDNKIYLVISEAKILGVIND